MAFTIESSAFIDGGPIPREYTCEGAGASPPLKWSGAPSSTRSFALIVDDPDAPDPHAPQKTWVHWVVYNLPADTASLIAGAAKQGLPRGAAQGLPRGAAQGLNDWNHASYGGPCPPIGRHRYVHKLYALDAFLPNSGPPTKAMLLKAMKGHVLGEAQLIGTYRMGE